MSQHLFKWKHFESEIIMVCVRWYLKYPLSYRMLVEMMQERGLKITHTTIMWNIINKNSYKLYINNKINLEIKVFDRQDYSEIYVNYKGYNIIFAMEVWGFGMDQEEWNIEVQMHGDIKRNASQMYYTVSKKDERAFIELIYFFINENQSDGMISEESKIQNW